MFRKTAVMLVLALLCTSLARAASSPYLFNFNIAFSTTEHDFAPGNGWGHLVDNYVDSYVRYSYHADGGVDNSGCLEIGSQHLYDGSFDYGDMTDKVVSDLLVTPPVSGQVTLKVKKTRSWSDDFGVKFYTVTGTSGNWVRGEEITPTTYSVSTDSFSTVVLPAQPAGTRIGIRGYYVMIDDFRADEADVELSRKLQIVSAAWDGGKYVDLDADGNFKLAYKFVLQNTGDYELRPGDEGFTIDLSRNFFTNAFATLAPDKAIAPGEFSDTLRIEATVSSTFLAGGNLFPVLREHITGTQYDLPQVTPTPFKADFRLTGAYGTTPLRTGNHIDFGTSRDTVSIPLLLRNNGAVAQTITALEASAGFAASLKAPVTIAPHDSIAFTVSLTPDVKGDKRGTLTVKGDNSVDIALGLWGYSVADNQTFYDFEDERVPEGAITYDNWYTNAMPTYIYSINNRYCIYTNHQDTVKFVLPKMEVKEGQRMSFECSKGYTRSFVDVLYSADRKNWTLAKSVQASEMSDSALAQSWTGYYYALKKFEVDNIPAGQWYIAFASGNSYIDNILADYTPVATTHDGYFADVFIAGSGKVGNEMQTRATFHNVMNHEEAAGNYALSFVIGDREYPATVNETLAARGEVTGDLWLTPADAGTLEGYWRFTAGGVTVDSAPVTMTIAPQDSLREMLTEHPVHHQYTTSAPMDPYNFNGESEFIYTPEEIRLPKGTVLTAISWYGTNPRVRVPVSVRLYLENTTDTAVTMTDGAYAMTDNKQMAQVFQGTTWLDVAGTTYVYDKVLTVIFKQPFVYDGGNLRIQFHGEAQSGPRVFFAANKGVRDQHRSIARNNATAASLPSTTIYADALPVIAIGYDASQTTGITGIRRDGNADPARFYDLNGRQLSAPGKGITIIKESDGTVRKVMQ